jgi:hypothetical protein
MRLSIALLAPFAAVLLIGCAAHQKREVVISLDQALSSSSSRPTILVDVVGLTHSERKQWDEIPLSAYWIPRSPLRASVRDRAVQVRFGPERSERCVVSIDSEIWTAWRKSGAQWLYVVANLPGGITDHPGADDPRRLAISLTSSEWAEDAPLLIEVRRDAVVFMTPRSAPAAARTN